MNAQQYYAHQTVRERIVEFLGGDSLATATAVFIAHGAVGASRRIFPHHINKLDALLDNGLDVARSLWDHTSLLVHLDIEYVNFDDPALPYIDPLRTFEIQQPVINTFRNMLRFWGVEPLCMLSGRGHHLIWRIARTSTAFHELVHLGRISSNIESYYNNNPVLLGLTFDTELARAYAGLGMIMEFLTNEAIHHATPSSVIPVTFSDVEVVPQFRGRETISIDVSEYSDPLNTRMIRNAFSIYSKALMTGGNRKSRHLMFFVPHHGENISESLSYMRNAEKACALSHETSVTIPEYNEQMLHVITAYRSSLLARFHEYYYEEAPQVPPLWAPSSEPGELDDLPCCIRNVLANPSKRLLRPAIIQLVVRTLFAEGWHPQHIAGLIRSKFEGDYGWGEEWRFYNPATRADFYVRAFAGALATGLDKLQDFSLADTKNKGYCLDEPDSCGMEYLREAAHKRRMEWMHGRSGYRQDVSTKGISATTSMQ